MSVPLVATERTDISQPATPNCRSQCSSPGASGDAGNSARGPSLPGNPENCAVADPAPHNIIMTAQNDQLQYRESRWNRVRGSKSLALGREFPRRIDSIIPWSFIPLNSCLKYPAKASHSWDVSSPSTQAKNPRGEPNASANGVGVEKLTAPAAAKAALAGDDSAGGDYSWRKASTGSIWAARKAG